jgi:hypothetical protein
MGRHESGRRAYDAQRSASPAPLTCPAPPQIDLREEEDKSKNDLEAQGFDTGIVTFDDGEWGVFIRTKRGPSLGIDRVEFLEAGLEMAKELS